VSPALTPTRGRSLTAARLFANDRPLAIKRLFEGSGEVLVWGTVAWAMLAIGTTTGVGVVTLWALANLSCLVNVLNRRFRLDLGVALLSSLAVLTLLQSVALPPPAVAALDPDVAQTWTQTFELLGLPSSASLSIQPLTTRLEAMKLWAYAGTWGCVAGFVTRRGVDAVIRRLAVLVGVVVVLTIFHRMLGLQRVYGFYEPKQVDPYWVGPLLNANNLGGLCNLGTFITLSLTFRGSGEERKSWLFVGLLLGFVVMTLLTGSRGAVGALGLGLLAFAGLLWRHRRTVSTRRWGLVLVIGTGLVLSALLFDQERLLSELGDRSVEKVNTIRWALNVVRRHGSWGIGKGALDAEMPTVQPLVGTLLYPHVECFPVDWALAWGVPIAMLTVASTLCALAKRGANFRVNLLRIGLCVVLLQNLFDLGLEVPGLTLPWLVVFATFWTSLARAQRLRSWSPRVLLLTVGAFAAAVAVLGIPLNFASETRLSVLEGLRGGPSGSATRALNEALRSNPGDHSLLRARALDAASTRDPNTLAWINLALLRAPNSALTYLTLGQVLWSRGVEQQALGAFRKAAEDESVHQELTAWLSERDADALIEIAPQGRLGAALLSRAAAQSEPHMRERLLRTALERSPDSPHALADFLEWQVGAIVSGQRAECAEDKSCLRALQTQVETLERHASAPQAAQELRLRVELLKVRLRSLQGETQAAFETLQVICRGNSRGLACANTVLELARKLGGATFDEAASQYLEKFCSYAPQCLPERLAMARELLQAGRLTAALQQYVAGTSTGADASAFVGASEAAALLGREREALHWLTKGEQRFGSDDRLVTQRARLGLPPRDTVGRELQPESAH
jgi:hypothetical protein